MFFSCIFRIAMLWLFSGTPGGGTHWRGTRAAALADDSGFLSYCQYPPTSNYPGAQTQEVLDDRDPQK